MPQLAISNLPTGIISDLLEQINDSLKTIAERSHDHQAKLVELANDIAEMKTRLQQRDERHNFPLANHSLRWATAPLKTATRTSPVNSTGMEHEGNGLVKAPDDQVYERAPDTHAYQVSPSRWITDPSTIEQLNATARVDFYAFSKFGPRLQSRLEGQVKKHFPSSNLSDLRIEIAKVGRDGERYLVPSIVLLKGRNQRVVRNRFFVRGHALKRDKTYSRDCPEDVHACVQNLLDQFAALEETVAGGSVALEESSSAEDVCASLERDSLPQDDYGSGREVVGGAVRGDVSPQETTRAIEDAIPHGKLDGSDIVSNPDNGPSGIVLTNHSHHSNSSRSSPTTTSSGVTSQAPVSSQTTYGPREPPLRPTRSRISTASEVLSLQVSLYGDGLSTGSSQDEFWQDSEVADEQAGDIEEGADWGGGNNRDVFSTQGLATRDVDDIEQGSLLEFLGSG